MATAAQLKEIRRKAGIGEFSKKKKRKKTKPKYETELSQAKAERPGLVQLAEKLNQQRFSFRSPPWVD